MTSLLAFNIFTGSEPNDELPDEHHEEKEPLDLRRAPQQNPRTEPPDRGDYEPQDEDGHKIKPQLGSPQSAWPSSQECLYCTIGMFFFDELFPNKIHCLRVGKRIVIRFVLQGCSSFCHERHTSCSR